MLRNPGEGELTILVKTPVWLNYSAKGWPSPLSDKSFSFLYLIASCLIFLLFHNFGLHMGHPVFSTFSLFMIIQSQIQLTTASFAHFFLIRFPERKIFLSQHSRVVAGQPMIDGSGAHPLFSCTKNSMALALKTRALSRVVSAEGEAEYEMPGKQL